MRRIFLGVDRPPLVSAAREFVRFSDADELPLVVLPGGRAVRRFQELLVAVGDGVARIPRTLTVGELPELLYQPKLPNASPLERQLAWIFALERISETDRNVLFPYVERRGGVQRLRSIAKLLEDLSNEVLGAMLSFAEVGERVGSDLEAQRWQALERLHSSFCARLSEVGLSDKHCERRAAVRSRQVALSSPLVLIGIVDLPKVTETMVQLLHESAVEVWIASAQERNQYFTDLGLLRSDLWIDEPLPTQGVSLSVVDDYAKLADRVLQDLRLLSPELCRDEVLLSVGDSSVVPYLEGALRDAQVPVHHGESRVVGQSLVLGAIQYLLPLIERKQQEDFAAAIRHAVLEAWFVARHEIEPSFLERVDRWERQRLPYDLESVPKGEVDLQKMMKALEDLLAPFKGPKRSLTAWCSSIQTLLTELSAANSATTAGSESEVMVAVESELLGWHSLVDQSVQWSGTDALRLLLDRMALLPLAEPPNQAALEIVGWLEMPLDDSRVAIIAGGAEGQIPQVVEADPFLPNSLRSSLGITDDNRRLARDLYVLQVVLASRELVRCVTARTDPSGNPLMLSRLFLLGAGGTREALLSTYYGHEQEGGDCSSEVSDGTLGTKSAFEVVAPPDPAVVQQWRIDSIPVTSFRYYLECPYRYYLRQVLGISAVDRMPRELTPGLWGTVMHAVLCAFGNSEERESTDPRVISAFLEQEVDRYTVSHFGRGVVPSAIVQLAAMKLRLRRFAEWQARWRQEGWCISNVEVRTRPGQVRLELGSGRTIGMHGTMDRIDVQQGSNRWCIIDYKTGDEPKTPQAVHRNRSGAWTDLQLPAYRYLATKLEVIPRDAEIMLAFLPIQSGGALSLQPAEWTPEELAQAEEVMRDVARKILDRAFWPPNAAHASEYPLEEFLRRLGNE